MYKLFIWYLSFSELQRESQILIGTHKMLESIISLTDITIAIFDDADICLNRKKIQNLIGKLSIACQKIAFSHSINRVWLQSIRVPVQLDARPYGLANQNKHFIVRSANKMGYTLDICELVKARRSKVIIFCVSSVLLLSVIIPYNTIRLIMILTLLSYFRIKKTSTILLNFWRKTALDASKQMEILKMLI